MGTERSTRDTVVVMRETQRTPHDVAPPEVVYRFEVEDPKTGSRYFVLIGEDGMAYREAVEESLRKAG